MAQAALTPWRCIASGLGAGRAPAAPGTCGSLLGLALGCLLLHAGHEALLAGIILITAIGLYAIARLPEADEDPGWIVIDEIAGQMIPLLALSSVTPRGAALCFILFRIFDIWKPGPVAWADRRKDAYGIMGDDTVAGLLAWLAVLAVGLAVPL
jgi:phosphatidylglycerophosphatase A